MPHKPTLSKVAREFFRQSGRRGGKASAANLTPEQRHERALRAVRAREEKRRREAEQQPQPVTLALPQPQQIPCPLCASLGPSTNCSRCHGSGEVTA